MTGLRYGFEEDDERGRGVLSPADRKYLHTGGSHLKNENTRNNTALRIRQRIRDAIIDFDLICRLLDDDKEIEKVFSPIGDELEDTRFRAGMKSMIEFLYLGLERGDAGTDFETTLESGVHDAEIKKAQGPATVRVDFDVDTQTSPHLEIERAREKFENGESLSVGEIGSLIALGVVEDEDEIQELAEHAQEKATFPATISPMLAAEMASNAESEEDQKMYESWSEIEVPLPGSNSLDYTTQFWTRSETLPIATRIERQAKENDGGDEGDAEDSDE